MHLHSRARSLKKPQGQGFIAAASMKRAGKRQRHRGARNRNRAVFQRLPHHLQHVARKLRQLVEKEHAVVRQRNFSGARYGAAADQSRVADGVVRRAERPHAHQSIARVQHSGHAVNLGRLQRFFKRQRRKDRRHALGKHRLAAARRSDHQNVVSARAGHFHGALGRVLAAYILEVHGKVLNLVRAAPGYPPPAARVQLRC